MHPRWHLVLALLPAMVAALLAAIAVYEAYPPVLASAATVPTTVTTTTTTTTSRFLKVTMMEEDEHFPDLFPLSVSDYIGFACAVAGLMMAAGGGIGGGGILVPIYILLFEFPVKRKLNKHQPWKN